MTIPTPAPDHSQQPVAPHGPIDATPAPPAGYSTPPAGYGTPAPAGYGTPPTGYGTPPPAGNRPPADAWHGLTSYWVTYPAGFGLVALALAALLPLLLQSESAVQAALAGAGFVVLGVAVYAEILVALLFLVRTVDFEGLGKLVWLVGTVLFAGMAYLGCLVTGNDPWLLTIVALFAGMVTLPVGQWIARTLLHGRRVPTLVCLAICAIFVVISLVMLPMSLGS